VNFFTSSFKAGRYLTALIGGIIGVFFLFAGASEFLIRSEFIERDVLLPKAALFRETRGADAIFGDSRAFYGLTLTNFINNALGGDSIYDSGEKLRWYYAKRHGFKVILALSPDSFQSHSARDTASSGRARSFYRVLFFRDDTTDGWFSYWPPYLGIEYYRNRIFRIWETWIGKGSFVSDEQLAPDGHDIVPGELVVPSAEALAKWRDLARGEARLLAGFDRSYDAAYLNVLFDWLRKRGAHVCVITPPHFHAFADAVLNSPQYNDFFTALRNMSERYGFQYANYYWNEWPSSYFVDPLHLNPAGAKVVSNQVRRDCDLGSAP